VADDGSQQRKPDFRTAIEDVKAIAAVVLSRKLNLRSPAVRSPAVVVAAIGAVATLILALVVVTVLAQTGGAKTVSDNAALIGALVALGGVFTAQLVSIALDAQRTQEARELEARRAHEAALQNYIEQVGTLLIEQPLHRASPPGDNLSTVVRAQTLAVLEGLDPGRKGILLQFLYESGLIYKDKPVVSLVWANMSYANLFRAALEEANLRGVNLGRATLEEAFLYGANLSDTYLIEADMTNAHLNKATNLKGANLSGANLNGAADITNEELEQQAYSLEGATMPDGSKHP
jgi:Pentapeptide repeats (8 copies)